MKFSQTVKYLFFTLLSIISIFIFWINIRLYSENFTPSEKKADIILQLNFLEQELKSNNLGERMQKIFPEGFVFINALYGLSWCELAHSCSQNDPKIKERAIKEALFAYNELNKENAKRTFDRNLVPENGIFYFGWKNYLLSKIISADTTFYGPESYQDTFKVHCEIIRNLIKKTENPYFQSYHDLSWPADMFVTVASLSNHDKIFKPKYQSDIIEWMMKVKERLDTATQMVPHQVDPETGRSTQGARGSSMSLMLRMLAEINQDFAKEQYELFKKNFVTTTLGLPSIREYPKGQNGPGDVDSGPVILGVGFSATIVMIGTFSMFESGNLAEKQYKSINAMGFAYKNGNQKKYLSGKLPMADAFIAWVRASGLSHSSVSTSGNDKWRIEFHAISLSFIVFQWFLLFWKKIISKIKKQYKIN